MSPQVDIIIKTIDQSSQPTKQTIGSFTELNSAISLVSKGMEIAKKVYAATAGETLKYANEVRQLSTISGQSTEATSRFLQVIDDYKLSADDALAATKALTKNGHAPSIETLAKLSDKYLQLNGTEEKNAFILQNLGKGGLQWVEVLNKGSKALIEQGKAVADNLILSKKQVDAARANEIAIDNYNDAILGMKISIGNQLLPVITNFVNGLNEGQRAAEIMTEKGLNPANKASKEYRDALAQAHAEQVAATSAMLQSADAGEQNAQSMKDQEAAAKAMSDANEQFISVLGTVSGAWTDYRGGVADARKELADGKITLDEYNGKVRELGAAYEDTKNSVVLSIVAMKLAQDGWTNAELDAYLKIGKSLGAFTGAQVEAAKSALKTADDLVGAARDEGTAFQHVQGRSEDAVVAMDDFYAAQAVLASGIRKDALPASAALARTIGGMPASRSWEYDFYVNVFQRGAGKYLSQFANNFTTSSSLENIRAGSGGGLAAGGQLGGKWALVGDAPGGGLTPYSELISPSGYVFPADVTKKMFDSGMIDGVKGMRFGGDLPSGGVSQNAGNFSHLGGPTTRRRRASGSRMGSPAGGGGLNISANGGGLAEVAAVTATAVAQDATVVASQSLTAAQTVANNVQAGTQQTVSAQFQSSNSVVDAIERQTAVMNKVLTEIRGQKYSQQLSI